MGVKAVFYMKVYNTPEKYIRRAIESVLNQTDSELLLIIRDNGTTDNTRNILKEYQEEDNRVIVYRNEENNVLTEMECEIQSQIFKKYVFDNNTEYFAFIDSDDYYELNFLEKAYNVANIHNTDLVVFNNSFVDEKTEKILGYREFENLIVKNKNINSESFEMIYNPSSTLWGKLFSVIWWERLFELMEIGISKKITISLDTYTMLILLKEMNNIHYINDFMYNYRMQEVMLYQKNVNLNRIKIAYEIYEKGYELLEEWDILNNNTVVFLLSHYRSNIKRLLELTLNTNETSVNWKLNYIKEILNDDFIKEMSIAYDIFINDIYNSLIEIANHEKKDIKLIKNTFNSPVSNELEKIFNMIHKNIEEGQFNISYCLIRELQREMPLNNEIIYLRILLEKKVNNKEQILLYSKLVKLFFSNDQKILNLINT